MILIKGREMIIPNNERYIGTDYDESSENRQFLLPRLNPSGTDLAEMTFTLDFTYNDGTKDAMVLDLDEVTDETILLTWLVTAGQVQHPGTVFIQIRATDSEGTVRWSSFQGTVYVEYEIQSYEDYQGDLSELQYYEVQYHRWNASEEERKEAEAEREEFFAQLQAWYEISVEALEDTSIGGMTEVIAEVKTELEQEMGEVSGGLETLERTVSGIRDDLDAQILKEDRDVLALQNAVTKLGRVTVLSVPASGWASATYNSQSVYKQEVQLTGITEDDDPDAKIYHVSTYTKTQWAQAMEAFGTFTESGWADTAEDKVIFYCYEQPAYDFSVTVKGV